MGVAALIGWLVTAFIGLYFTTFTLVLLTVLGVGGS